MSEYGFSLTRIFRYKDKRFGSFTGKYEFEKTHIRASFYTMLGFTFSFSCSEETVVLRSLKMYQYKLFCQCFHIFQHFQFFCLRFIIIFLKPSEDVVTNLNSVTN